MNSTRLLRVVALVATIALALPPAALGRAEPKITVGLAYGLAGPGFDGMAHEGAVRAANEFRLKLIEISQPSALNPDLTKLANRSDLVVAVGFLYQEAAAMAAGAGTNVAVLDSGPGGGNLMGTAMAANEGSFLVGAAAAMASTTGKIGFIGGIDQPVIFEFRDGFVAGVTYQDPTASVAVAYGPPDFSGFNDPDFAYDTAMGMYETGIDVIYHAAGNSGIGLFEAARDYSQENSTHVWAIGVDNDQYLEVADDLQPYILTSMVKRLDVVTYDIIAAQVHGTFAGGDQRWDLSHGGVDYATSGGFIGGMVPTLEQIRLDIIGGLITVPLWSE